MSGERFARGHARHDRPVLVLVLAGLLALGVPPWALAHPASGEPPLFGQALTNGAFIAASVLNDARPGAAPGDAIQQVGFAPLPGFNADVWVQGDYAYVGTWGDLLLCPATGVRVIDVRDPAAPRVAGAVAAIPGTTQEDVEVMRVAVPTFQGDLLVTGIQGCARDGEAAGGLDLWDVTNPAQPRHLAFWASSPSGAGAGRGVHEFHLFQRDGRLLVAAAVPYAELFEGVGDFRLVDITDPRRPEQIAAWGLGGSGLAPRCDNDRCYFAHSARTNAAGTLVAVSYWDAGAVLLDISDLARPRYLGRTAYSDGAPGNTHAAWFAAGDTILATTDELLTPTNGGWGYLRLWDISDRSRPRQMGEFATSATRSATPPGPGYFTAHNPFIVGTTAYVSWFADGVRVLDLTDPTRPREIGAFVPPAVADPFGKYPASASVWGVYVVRDTVYLSDINAGLYVLRGHGP